MHRRPPPLQLPFDNFFPGLAGHQRMQIDSLLSAVYQRNWRVLALCLATINTLRFYFSAVRLWAWSFLVTAVEDLRVDLSQNNFELASVSRTLATIYTVACAIELFGAFSILIRRRAFIRTYAYLAFLSAALVTGAGVVTTTAYFAFSDELLRECVVLASAGQLDTKSFFRGDAWPTTPLSVEDAKTQCLDVWGAESVSTVVSTALFYLLPAAVCFAVAYVYHCQTADAAHVANIGLTARGRESASATALRLEAIPYAPLPGSDVDTLKSTARPKPQRRTTVSPRSYQTGVAVAPVAIAGGSSLSPGPPSFSIRAGDSGYQGLRLSAGAEDDTFI
ncbi:hypothetical protein GGX14DRAFT_658900 [Mycena pura]|uniref:Uncharacterized protein n=1 Tax=Mycena pura TaxID=153505 RepID=A0AAD6V676_9AGAR|nr:hypothetical protein GGX14DRAFT_658900 [Mycena pura]